MVYCFLYVPVRLDPDSAQEILFGEVFRSTAGSMQKRQHGDPAEVASAPSLSRSSKGGEYLLTGKAFQLFFENGEAGISVWECKGND